ncbi:MAG: hypothetical protein A3J18_01510 [Candidatus Levybacteria bacterium RIFCSPLOWO2_02_FULL_40_18]|nr:MAG: hypothetical protein A3D82_01020 [Candidatus Levybacteria bacterium RIFCSPHIGHO2_02_FULL_40_29]OGH50822.1 MAG: hypothetical protein A3J18_01510 [Candidatus Levybacteria bacterium RIFCSPLOWO2_02_FULL_40_18]OGH54726.1 MAG: hypothetical protein A2596_03710 [Candidatus Levybacteria bacterium RIFOXYD1_FULL_40_21]
MKIVLENNMFFVTDIGRFQKDTMNSARGFFSLVQNPTKSELMSGIYKPKLTLQKRFNSSGRFEPTLSIELSLPKLLYGNNFEELDDENFKAVAKLLQTKLSEMGVKVFWELFIKAPVSSVHYSKNIKLTNGLIAFTVLKELSKANITKRLDFNQSDFRNEGHSIKWHANTWELTFYDKIKDLEQAKISEKRAIEKDNSLQMNLFSDIQEARKHKPFEVLRMELRINTRQKLRKVLSDNGYKVEPTFQNIFKKEIAQKILLSYLEDIEKGYPKPLYFDPKSSKDFIAQFEIDNTKTKIKDVFTALGFRKALEENNPRELRELLKKHPRNSWYDFNSQMNSYNYPKNSLDVFKPIRQSIEQFEPLSLVDFEAEMINNDK